MSTVAPLITSPTLGELEVLRKLVRERSGIVLSQEKQYLIESRLGPLMRTRGIRSWTDLVIQLQQTATSAGLTKAVVEAMTTNETFFFRDQYPFEALQRHILPKLIAARAQLKALDIWCAASSSGQEPYSIAMILREYFSSTLQGWKVRIIATDISSDMIARCQAGVYSAVEMGRGLTPSQVARHFVKSGDLWTIHESLRSMVEFRVVNLLDPWPHASKMDIVFCRNVLIYFDDPTKKKILGRIHALLRTDGYLFLGGAETTISLDDRFERANLDRAGAFTLKPPLPA